MAIVIFISAAMIFLIIFTIICKKLIKKLEIPEIEWYDQKELPTEMRIDRDISEDILVFDLERKKLYIGYYSFGNDMWVMDEKINRNNFLWAYLN